MPRILNPLTCTRRLLSNTTTTNPLLQALRKMSSGSAAASRLAGKTILITGASSGIGRSTALEFARTAGPGSKLRIILAARRVDALRKIADDIKAEVKDVDVLPAKLDVSNADEVSGFVGQLPEEWRDIHVLVNNAYVTLTLFIYLLHRLS